MRILPALLACAWMGAAFASERSELLVAQGEVAYHAGRLEEARERFIGALAADPDDEAARGWLEVLTAGLPRAPARGETPEQLAERWDLEVGTGLQYDSNVRLDPSQHHDDAAFLFTLAGHVDPWRDDKTLVRLDYDFFQSVHTHVNDYDLRSNRFRGTLSRAVIPGLWLGVQGGYDHAVLHTHAYLQAPWVMPYASIVEGDRGATQFTWRHDDQDYLGQPFGTGPIDRDGTLDAAGVNQLLFFFDRRLAANVGYTYEAATPYSSSGDDFKRRTHQARVGVQFPAGWRTLVSVDYVFRYDDYTEPNSAVDGRKTRQDDGNYVSAWVRRPIMPHLDAVLSYFVTVNASNIRRYQYDRQVVALELRYDF